MGMFEKLFCVYIMANVSNKVLYTGVTSNLPKRVYEHREHLVEGFTKKYNVDKLVYYETSPSADGAILREKQIKAGSRDKKIELIEKQNRDWRDLFTSII